MNGPDRLIGRIHRRWRANGSVRHPSLSQRDRAELEARIDRLHTMGDCFTYVTLNDEVMQACATRMPTRKKGAFVATEA